LNNDQIGEVAYGLLSIGTVMTSIIMLFSGYEDSYNVIQLFMAIIPFVVKMLLYEHS